MSEPSVPPAPKKGMSTGAKIAIGCGIAVLLGIGGCFVVTGFFVKKGVDTMKDFAETAQKDPDMAAYKLALGAFKLNPEVEVVSSDADAKTITVRNKKDGKEVTFNLADIKAGRLSIESDGETVNFEGNTSPDGKSGSFKVTSDKGSMTIGGEAEIPDWVPVYPGARTEGHSSIKSGTEASGTFTIHTPDSSDRVVAYYEHELKAAGFEVQKSTLQSSNATGGNVNARLGNRTVNVTVATQEGETQGLVAFTEKLEGE